MKIFIMRLVLWGIIASAGPILWWLGGGIDRSPALAILTFFSAFAGGVIVTFPAEFPWE